MKTKQSEYRRKQTYTPVLIRFASGLVLSGSCPKKALRGARGTISSVQVPKDDASSSCNAAVLWSALWSALLVSTASVCILLSGCIKLPPIIHDINPVNPVKPPVVVAPTNNPDAVPPAPPPPPPAPANTDEVIDAFPGTRPSIALDSLGQPHVVVDHNTDRTIMIYHRIAGVWSGGVLAQGSQSGAYKASRIYIPHIEIDSQDRAWINAKMGTKEWGSMYGQGVWMIPTVATAPGAPAFVFVDNKGYGNVSLLRDSVGSVVFFCTEGNWYSINTSGQIAATGRLALPKSGEKIRSAIAGDVWHAAMNGYSQSDSLYRNNRLSKPVAWASHLTYPEMGSDMCHPSLAVDLVNPALCYISSVYNAGVVINLWTGSNMLWSTTNLPVIARGGNMGGPDRFGPQWASAPGGGAWLTYVQAKRIKLRKVLPDGRLTAPQDICQGANPAIVCDPSGSVHMVYRSDGLHYRRIAQ